MGVETREVIFRVIFRYKEGGAGVGGVGGVRGEGEEDLVEDAVVTVDANAVCFRVGCL